MARSTSSLYLPLLLALVATPVAAQPPASDGVDERAKAWAELLKGDDPEDHALATTRLLKIGVAARPALEKALVQCKSGDQRARLQAVLTLLPKPAAPAPEGPASPPLGDVEVHAVGIHYGGAYFFLMMPHSRGIDWVGMCDLLVSQGESKEPRFSKRIWELLSPTARELAQDEEFLKAADDITHDRRREKPDERVLQRLSILERDIGSILTRGDLVRKDDRIPQGLHPEAAALLEANRPLSLFERHYLHRRLFEAAFAGFVKPLDFTLNRNVITVKVGRTEKPAVVVLTCYNTVRWRIEAEPDAKIERIIVGGYHVQDVVGFQGRIDYYVADMPNLRPAAEPRSFHGYPQDESQYATVKGAVKKILGRELDSVQGRYEVDQQEPIVIGKLKAQADQPLRRRPKN